MKRLLRLVLLAPLPLVFSGCPIYGGDFCDSTRDCAPGFVCQVSSGQCVAIQDEAPDPPGPFPSCTRPSDCELGETCTGTGQCRPGSCRFSDCVDGYECSIVQGVFECVAEGSADASVPAVDASVPAVDGAVPAATDGGSGPAEAASPADGGPTEGGAMEGGPGDAAPVGDGKAVTPPDATVADGSSDAAG